jgi:hypothetical protein
MSDLGVKVTVDGYRQMLTDLRKIEPDLTTQMRREVRAIAAPLRQAIKTSIPKTSPLSHMRKTTQSGNESIGRLRWGAGNKPANYTSLDLKKPKRNKKAGTSLARILVTSPATVMADMAGKSNKYVGARQYAKGTKSNSMVVTAGKYKGQLGYPYQYKNGVSGRMHRNTGGQGRGMIKSLGSKPSRYVYSSVERALPSARIEVLKIVNKYASIVNRRTR